MKVVFPHPNVECGDIHSIHISCWIGRVRERSNVFELSSGGGVFYSLELSMPDDVCVSVCMCSVCVIIHLLMGLNTTTLLIM